MYTNHYTKNIILDLDNTLICSVMYSQTYIVPRDIELKSHNFPKGNCIIYERPHLKEILYNLSKKYTISVWTSASKEYGRFVIDKCFPKYIKINFFYSNEDTELCLEKYHRVKPLEYVYENNPGYNKLNTIIIDDLVDVSASNPNNTLQIKPFIIVTDMYHIYNKKCDKDEALLMMEDVVYEMFNKIKLNNF